MSDNMRKVGNRGEDAVCAFLEQKGYTILARNFTRRGGEIDIIAKDQNTLVFCEVKTRKNDRLASASEAVTPAKRKRIIQCARCYLYETDAEHCDVRFDVAEVYTGGKNPAVHYLENAFWEE